MRILANAGPQERLAFVKRIMHSRGGEVVAVTASGVNDDQVLTSADVGLTMVSNNKVIMIMKSLLLW